MIGRFMLLSLPLLVPCASLSPNSQIAFSSHLFALAPHPSSLVPRLSQPRSSIHAAASQIAFSSHLFALSPRPSSLASRSPDPTSMPPPSTAFPPRPPPPSPPPLHLPLHPLRIDFSPKALPQNSSSLSLLFARLSLSDPFWRAMTSAGVGCQTGALLTGSVGFSNRLAPAAEFSRVFSFRMAGMTAAPARDREVPSKRVSMPKEATTVPPSEQKAIMGSLLRRLQKRTATSGDGLALGRGLRIWWI